MKDSKKTQRQIDDMLLYITIISFLLNSHPLSLDGVDVSDDVRAMAINGELLNLRSAIGIQENKFNEYAKELDWSETSPEQRELNNILTQANLLVMNSANNNGQEQV